MRAAIPSWLYILVALAIALTAFGLGQLKEGLGVPFVLLTTTLWTAWSVNRQRNWVKKND
ncbi:MAG: hypothetical protein QHC40_15270 [Sphingobium sp.]|nr:hypothetical protein [Sphingobium sp.]